MFVPPAGLPLSTFAPQPVSTLGAIPAILADKIDPATGDVADLLEGDDPIDAAIQWQFTVRQGAGAALGDNGHRLHLITKATESAPLRIADEGRRVLAKFRERGDIDNVNVSGDVTGGSTAIAALVAEYTNTTTSERAGVRIGGV